MPSIKKVAIWPIAAVPLADRMDKTFPGLQDMALLMDPDFREYSERISVFAESILLSELRASELFILVAPDYVFAELSEEDPSFSRFKKTDRRRYRDVIDADGFLMTDISFAREADGVNTYVTLTLYDSKTSNKVIEAKFNTKWGKSYWLSQQINITLPDGIRGAVNGLAKALRKFPTLRGNDTSN